MCYGMSENEIDELEKVDEYLMRGLLKAHSKTPIEALYLETGVIPIKSVIMSRRLSYLKNILNKNEHELVHKVYKAQMRKPVKNDWVTSVDNDKKKINMTFTEHQIKKMSKKLYKKNLKQKIRKNAFLELINLKERHSKMKNVNYKTLSLQPYLSDSRFSLKQKQLLFKLRTRMLDVKGNFKSMFQGNIQCDLCNEDVSQSQDHLLDCQKLIDNCSELYNNVVVEHDDIFGKVDKQLSVVRLYQKVLEVREKLQDQIDLN